MTKLREKNNKIESKISTKDQSNQELVLWKDKQDWQTLNQIHQEKKKDRGSK